MADLDTKLTDVFAGRVVRKDLVQQARRTRCSAPCASWGSRSWLAPAPETDGPRLSAISLQRRTPRAKTNV